MPHGLHFKIDVDDGAELGVISGEEGLATAKAKPKAVREDL